MLVKRFKNMVLVAGCLMGMAACQREEVVPMFDAGERILFGVPMLTVEGESRSVLKDALTEGDEFGVMGYCVPYMVGTTNLNYTGATSNWETKKSMCAPLVFNKQCIRVDVNGCVYDKDGGTENDPKYWYQDGRGLGGESNSEVVNAEEYQYTFFAYYPCQGAFTVSSASGDRGAPVFRFDMPFSGGNVTTPLTQEVPDAMLAAVYTHQSGNGNVHFNFSHLLTGLTFDVHNFSDNKELKVYEIALYGEFWKSIVVSLDGRSPEITFPTDTYKGVYEVFRNGAGQNIPVSVDGTDVKPITDEFLLLVPGPENDYLGPSTNGQGQNSDIIQVKIRYSFNGGEVKEQSFTRPTSFTPRSGTKYTAQLNFVGDAFVLQFVVNNGEVWEDGEADDGDEGNDDVLFE